MDETFTYDQYGNRLTKSGVSGEWSYDVANKLISYGNVSYTYNANGNPEERAVDGAITHKYFYDIADRLVAVENGLGQEIARHKCEALHRQAHIRRLNHRENTDNR